MTMFLMFLEPWTQGATVKAVNSQDVAECMRILDDVEASGRELS